MAATLNSVLALAALGLALVAVVLATLANRRWASRPWRAASGGSPDPAAASVSSAPAGDTADPRTEDRLTGLDSAVTALGGRVDGLATRVDDLGASSLDLVQGMDLVREQVAQAVAQARDASADPSALRHVALVRYDAFADVGGRLSYSVAVLDDTSSGLVLTTLAGKSDVRTYVRTISAGVADGSLTAEEQQAIDVAVGSSR